jgi:hypothetical protein
MSKMSDVLPPPQRIPRKVVHLGSPGQRVEFRTEDVPGKGVQMVLKVYEGGTTDLIATVNIGDPCSAAQACYEYGYPEATLGLERGSRRYATLLRRARKGLGYTYP